MREIEARLLRRVRRRARIPRLIDVLAGTRPVAYARRRLSLPAARACLLAFLYALEAAALALVFDPLFLAPIVAVRMVSSIGHSAIWGLTESLRRDVRAELKSGNPLRARTRIEAALGRALVLGAVVAGGAVAWSIARPHLGLFSVVDALIIAVALRLGISVVVRTYHSGLYATRRVHRPPWSLLVPDLLDGLGLFLLWRVAGPWSVALTVVASTSLQAILTGYYVRRGYRASPIGSPRPALIPRRLRPRGVVIGRGAALGLAGLAFELPSLLVLGLWAELSVVAATAALFLYGVRPMSSFLSGVARLYYVDIIRARALGPLGEERLFRHLDRVLALCSVAFVAVTTILWITASSSSFILPLTVLAMFLAFSIASAIFSLEAIRSMSVGTAPAIGTGAALALIPAVAALAFDLTATAALAAALVASAAAALWLRRVRRAEARAPEREARRSTLLPLRQWLEITRAVKGSGRVVRMTLENPGARLQTRLAVAVARESGLPVTRWGTACVLVLEPEGAPGPTRSWQAAARGVARVQVGEAPAGELAAWRGALPRDLREILERPSPSADNLVNRAAKGAHARVIRATGASAAGQAGNFGDLSRALSAFEGGRAPRATRWGDFDIAVLWDQHGPSAILLLPLDVDPALRAKVRTECWHFGLQSAWRASGALAAGILPSPNKRARPAT